MPISKSRNVSTYVKAMLAHRQLTAQLEAREEKLQPLRRRILMASVKAKKAETRLPGGQKAEADRLLAMDPATLACLAKPCKPPTDLAAEGGVGREPSRGMGRGKSTAVREAAKALGVPHTDIPLSKEGV